MRNRDGDYYEIELDLSDVLEGSGIEEAFYLKDLHQRKLFINGEIDQFSVAEVSKHIMQFNKEDKDIAPEDRKPILLYVTSNGGDVDSGFGLIDVILNSKTPVFTINLAFQYSMGFLIGLAGHKRYAAKYSKFLMHDGYSFSAGTSTKVQDEMAFRKKEEARIKEYVISRSNITSKEYDKKLRVEWYLFADEAKERGFTDYIIGEDCDLDEII